MHAFVYAFLKTWFTGICLFKNLKTGRAQWLKPVIPALWEAEVGGSPEASSLRPTYPTW